MKESEVIEKLDLGENDTVNTKDAAKILGVSVESARAILESCESMYKFGYRDNSGVIQYMDYWQGRYPKSQSLVWQYCP